jgi:hypothetical protein
MDDEDLQRLLIERHGLALTVTTSLAQLHQDTIDELYARVGKLEAWTDLAAHLEHMGGRVNEWKQSYDGLPGRWWDAMPPNPAGKETYVAGVGAHVKDVDGRFGLAANFGMHSRLSGLSGADFRAAIPEAELPPGDSSEWISKGVIRWEAGARHGDVQALIGTALEQIERYLRFVGKVVDLVNEHRQG